MVPKTPSISHISLDTSSTSPYIRSAGNYIINWASGPPSLRMTTAAAVRIHHRGVHFIKHGWNIRKSMLESKWEQAYNCTLSTQGGLCDFNSSNLTGIAFPTLNPPLINEDLDTNCSESRETGRIIASATAVGMRYDFSACDVLIAERDFLYAENSVLFITPNRIPDWLYWGMCIMIIFIVRCLSRYILMTIHKKTTNNSKQPQCEPSDITMHPVLCLTVVGLLLLIVVTQGTDMYVTEEDLFFFYCVIAYNSMYLLIFVTNKLIWEYQTLISDCHDNEYDPPFYNVLCGVLLLSMMRFYSGAETPYNGPVFFVIVMRLIVKLHYPTGKTTAAITRQGIILSNTTLLMDSFIISLMGKIGFRYQWEYNIAILSAAAVAADALIYAS